MVSIRFSAGNSWPLLRMIEYVTLKDHESLSITEGELAELRVLLADCLIHPDSGLVTLKHATVHSLSVAMKALDAIALKAEKLLGARNGHRSCAQARSLRKKFLEAKVRMDLAGGVL